jgi:hypothetical protein
MEDFTRHAPTNTVGTDLVSGADVETQDRSVSR